MESLTSRFTEFVRRLGDVEADQDVMLSNALIPAIDAEMSCDGVQVEFRTRYAGNGLLDNVIVTVSRESSTQLGGWLLACLVHGELGMCRLHIGESGQQIIVEVADEQDATPLWESISWSPRPDVEAWLLETLPLHTTLPNGQLRNENAEYYSQDDWASRSLLRFSGSRDELRLLAEFFLNFGLAACYQNYEYLLPSGNRAPRVLDANSFECRVEHGAARQAADRP